MCRRRSVRVRVWVWVWVRVRVRVRVGRLQSQGRPPRTDPTTGFPGIFACGTTLQGVLSPLFIQSLYRG